MVSRCEYDNCKRKINTLFDQCIYCKKNFCMKHNMMELHKCEKLDEYITNKKEKFKKSICAEKCTSSKIILI